MGVHGMDAIEHVEFSNMKFLYAQLQKADKIISY